MAVANDALARIQLYPLNTAVHMGQFIALPIFLPEPINVTTQFMRSSPWNAPLVFGVKGQRTNEPKEDVVIINHEMPFHAFGQVTPMPRTTQESLHLSRFQLDYRAATGAVAYYGVLPGPNPPDFYITDSGSKLGLDCTQMTPPGRRAAHGRFKHIRNFLYEEDPKVFEHLFGLIMYFWFQQVPSDPPELPHRRSDQEAMSQIATQLRTYRFVPGTGDLPFEPSTPMPAQAPDLNMDRTPSGAQFYGVPLGDSVPVTPFFQRMGFEMALSYSTSHSKGDLWNEFQRLASQHDKPEIHHLLITVGGPDEWGLIYPGDRVALEFLLDQPAWPRLNVRYLQKIILHSWETGEIVQLYPEITRISSGAFKGLVPPHQVIDSSKVAAGSHGNSAGHDRT